MKMYYNDNVCVSTRNQFLKSQRIKGESDIARNDLRFAVRDLFFWVFSSFGSKKLGSVPVQFFLIAVR